MLFLCTTGLTSTYLPPACISNCIHSLFPCCLEFLSPKIPNNLKLSRFPSLQHMLASLLLSKVTMQLKASSLKKKKKKTVRTVNFLFQFAQGNLHSTVSFYSLASYSAVCCLTNQKSAFKNKGPGTITQYPGRHKFSEVFGILDVHIRHICPILFSKIVFTCRSCTNRGP